MRLLRTNFWRLDAFLLIASFLLVAFYVMVAGSGFPLDDSWIHQTYARNLAQNGEWAFVPGEPSAASTSPLYTVMLAIGYVFGLPYVLWTHFLGATALAVMSMLIVRMVEWQLPTMRHAGLIAGLFAVTTWHMIWAAASGMETIIFSMLTIVLIYLAWREQYVESSKSVIIRGVLFGVFTAFTTLGRPEGILLAGIIGLVMLIARPQGNMRLLIVYGIASLIAFVLVMSPYIMLNIQLTGGFLPNTANAKFQQHEILLQLPYLTRIQNLIIPLLAGGQILLLPGLLIYMWVIVTTQKFRQWLMLLIPIFWSVALIMVYASRLPASYQHGRYVMPILPSVVMMGAIGVLTIINKRNQGLLPRVLSRVLLISAFLTSFAFAVVIAPPIYATDVAIINEEMVASAHWIDENILDDELLAIHDIGAVGYFSPRSMLDIAGLVSPDIAPIVEDPDALWAYMEERNAQYLMAFPNQIPGDSIADARLCQVFITDGKTVRRFGEPNMAIYKLAWDGNCKQ